MSEKIKFAGKWFDTPTGRKRTISEIDLSTGDVFLVTETQGRQDRISHAVQKRSPEQAAALVKFLEIQGLERIE